MARLPRTAQIARNDARVPDFCAVRGRAHLQGIGIEGSPVVDVRTLGIPTNIPEPIFLFRDDAALKAHAGYSAAKSGNPAAASQLVMDLAKPLALRRFCPKRDARYVPILMMRRLSAGRLAELSRTIFNQAVERWPVLWVRFVNAAMRSGPGDARLRSNNDPGKAIWRYDPRNLPDRTRGAYRRGSAISRRLPLS